METRQENVAIGEKNGKSMRERTIEIPSDVLGSYTGMTVKGERPVQDADDL